MRNYYLLLILLIFNYCTEKTNFTSNSEFENKKVDRKELIIIFNRNEKNTEFINLAAEPYKNLLYKRKNFDPPFNDPNLHINVYLKNEKVNVLRKNLDQMNVWFDSEMGYMDWFRLNFEKYYIIYQDEYLVKGSLDPEYSFTAYEVKIHTGGTE